jgi:hypothetical protein
MKSWGKIALILLVVAAPVSTDAAEKQLAKTPSTSKTTTEKPVYKPPLRGAPAGRIGGGTRGTAERESFSLLVLAPDHAGLTSQVQPCLYWYISKPTVFPIEFTITEKKAVKPLVEKLLQGPDKGGIQSVCLADFAVELKKEVQYKWFISMVIDPEQRSKDIMAGGIIQLMKAPEALAAKLSSADRGMSPFIYAEEGYWYDALSAISKMIEASPHDADLRKQRASLLGQVGLSEAAGADTSE